MKTKLPEPSKSAQEHSQVLTLAIKDKCPMSFANFMHMALYYPNYGYYTNDLTKIGSQGDFITAPEVSSLFSKCIAKQTEQVLKTLQSPNIIEFGAGHGTMAKDILLNLDSQTNLEHYYIVEVSGSLKQRQKQILQKSLPEHIFNKVIWLDSLPSKPIEAMVLANEVLDAMPIERLQLDTKQANVAYVDYDDSKEQFVWQYKPITSDATNAQSELIEFSQELIDNIGLADKKNYETEVNLNVKPWLASVDEFLSKGVILLIDYGYVRGEYYHPSRNMGTLRCHYQQLAHSDPFFYPGLQDITAHVDFSEVAEATDKLDLEVAGFTTQAHFLMNCGLLEIAKLESKIDTNYTEYLKTSQQIKTLTLPDEMGETFKVIALSKNTNEDLIGFS